MKIAEYNAVIADKHTLQDLPVADLAALFETIANDVNTPNIDNKLRGVISKLLTITCKTKSSSLFRDYGYIDAAMESLAQFPLAHNEEGKISAKDSLELITDPLLKQLVRVFAYTNGNTAITANRDMCALVPVWAYAHKKAKGTPYSDWSLDAEDMPELAFTANILYGIEHIDDVPHSREDRIALRREFSNMDGNLSAGNIYVKKLPIYDAAQESYSYSLMLRTLGGVGFALSKLNDAYAITDFIDLDANSGDLFPTVEQVIKKTPYAKIQKETPKGSISGMWMKHEEVPL